MENTDPKFRENQEGNPKPVEHDYPKHEQDPGPSPQAVNEKNNKGAGPALNWILPILVIALIIIYWLFFKDRPAVN
jgi:hypothetical protein